jgi:hypothetical protein
MQLAGAETWYQASGTVIVETEGVKGIWVLLCFLQAGPLQGHPLLEGVTTNSWPLSLWTT